MKRTLIPVLAAIATFVIPVTTTHAAGGPSVTEVSLDSYDGNGNGTPDYAITFAGRSYDSDANTTTFTYTVSIEDGGKDTPAISHVTLGLPLCDTLAFVSASPSELVSVGLDPTTGVYGVKWDAGQEKGTTATYSYTLMGNVPLGEVEATIKAALLDINGLRPGPDCPDGNNTTETYCVSGTVYIDANGNGVVDAGEPTIVDVTVALYDANGDQVGTTTTNADGSYKFCDLTAGEYAVWVPVETENQDFNEQLYEYFTPNNESYFLVTTIVDADSSNNDFGFTTYVQGILDDLNPADPDGDGFTFAGTGKTIGYWKHQHSVAIKGKGKAQVDAATVQGYLDGIELLYLPEPFQFADANEFQASLDILSSTSSDAADLLRKQLLGTELNEMAGQGLNAFGQLQDLLIWWGEYLAANSGTFTREELIEAKDVFDWINNTGE